MAIITDENLLRVKCEDVLLEEIDYLRNKLENELKKSGEQGRNGIGLAAPQIGEKKKWLLFEFLVKTELLV